MYVYFTIYSVHVFPKGKWMEYHRSKDSSKTLLQYNHATSLPKYKSLTKFISKSTEKSIKFTKKKKKFSTSAIKSLSIGVRSLYFAEADIKRLLLVCRPGSLSGESGNNRRRWKNRVIRNRGYGRERNAKGVEIEKSEIKGRTTGSWWIGGGGREGERETGKVNSGESATFRIVVVLFCSAMRETDGRVNERRARCKPAGAL